MNQANQIVKASQIKKGEPISVFSSFLRRSPYEEFESLTYDQVDRLILVLAQAYIAPTKQNERQRETASYMLTVLQNRLSQQKNKQTELQKANTETTQKRKKLGFALGASYIISFFTIYQSFFKSVTLKGQDGKVQTVGPQRQDKIYGWVGLLVISVITFIVFCKFIKE